MNEIPKAEEIEYVTVEDRAAGDETHWRISILCVPRPWSVYRIRARHDKTGCTFHAKAIPKSLRIARDEAQRMARVVGGFKRDADFDWRARKKRTK